MEWKVTKGIDIGAKPLYELLKLRVEVFCVEQDCPYQDLDDQDLLPTIYHVTAHEGDKLAACLRVMYNGSDISQVRISRVVVDEKFRNRGMGRELMTHGLETIKELQAKYPRKYAMLHGQSHLRKFYESFGFVVEGDEFLEDGIPHLTLVKEF